MVARLNHLTKNQARRAVRVMHGDAHRADRDHRHRRHRRAGLRLRLPATAAGSSTSSRSRRPSTAAVPRTESESSRVRLRSRESRTMPRTRDAAFFAAGGGRRAWLVGKVLPTRLDALSPLQADPRPGRAGRRRDRASAGSASSARSRRSILGFALLGIVRVEPAPVDVVFAILIAATYAVRHAQPRVPAFIAIPLALFAARDAPLDGQRDRPAPGDQLRVHHALPDRPRRVAVVGVHPRALGEGRDEDVHHRGRDLAALLGPLALYFPMPRQELRSSSARHAGRGPVQGPERLLARSSSRPRSSCSRS